jgi:AcrR family transcriptional regulator
MNDNDLKTREKIMESTLDLIKSEKDYSKITIRRIVSAAGVSLSAVNYHFGSKEKLINEVIKRPILEFLLSKGNPYEKYKDNPVKMLKELVKLPAKYLAENPNISSVSIISDMSGLIDNDLTEQTISYLMPAARQAFPNIEEKDIGLELWVLVSFIQTAFLRSRSFSTLTGIDYFNEKYRNMLLEKYIDMLVKKYGGIV